MKPGLTSGLRVDRYELLTEVARGGMGSVWLARGVRAHGFEKLFALKFGAVSEDDADGRAMFLDEVRIASRVDHPSVAQVYDVGEHEGQLYAVIEWVDGFSLRQLVASVVARHERFDTGILLQIAADACAALHAVHELRDHDGMLLDVVHRDVSPHNILVSHHGQTKVIDFGIARSRRSLAALPGQDSLKGKLRFMAPEQAFGEATDRRADVWSVGAVLFETMTGSPPCAGQSNEEVVRAIARYKRPPEMPASIPRATAAVLRKALQRRPQDRYATAAHLESALLAALRAQGGASASDVAAYVHATMGDTLELRRERIAMAIRRSDPPSSSAPLAAPEPIPTLTPTPMFRSVPCASRPHRAPSKVVVAFAVVGFVALVLLPWLRLGSPWVMYPAAAEELRARASASPRLDPCVPTHDGIDASPTGR